MLFAAGSYMLHTEPDGRRTTYVIDRCVRAGGQSVDIFVHRTPGTLLSDAWHGLLRWWG